MAKQIYEAKAKDGSGRVIQFTASEDATQEELQLIAERIFELENRNKKPKEPPKQELEARPEPAAEPAAQAPVAPPPGMLDPYKESAKQELSNVGAGAAGAGAGLATGILEARKMGPASILEKGAAGMRQGAGIAPRAPTVPAAAAPSNVPSILGPSGTPMAPPGGTPTPPTGGPPGGAPLRPPVGGSAVQNYGKAFGLTDIEAQRATDMTKQAGGVHDLTTQRREALNLLQERFPSDRFIENPRYGGLMTPEPSVGSGPRAQYVQPQGAPQAPLRPLPAPQPIPTGPKPMGALEEVTQLFRKMAEGESKIARGIGGAARALPVLSYPLAGYSIGSDVGSIQEELAKERPDYADIALRGVGALGTGLSLHPVTAPVGLPMATMAPLIAAGRRRMQQTPEATPQELEEASRPSFRMSRP